MTNNIAITAGSGTSVATDDVGGIHYQLVKLAQGVEDSATMVSSTNPLYVSTPDDVFTITPTLDTGAYATNEVLFTATDIANVNRASGVTVTLSTLVITDKADQKAEMILLFYDSTVTQGTINSSSSISDADALKFVGGVYVVTSDYVDLGGVSVAVPQFNPMMMKPATTSLFVTAMIYTAATYGASDLQFKFGFNR